MRAAGRLALLLALAPAPLSAQAWYTIGGGAGGNRVSCADCEKIERFWGGSGYLRAGGTVGRNVSVGGEFAFWQASIDGSDAGRFWPRLQTDAAMPSGTKSALNREVTFIGIAACLPLRSSAERVHIFLHTRAGSQFRAFRASV